MKDGDEIQASILEFIGMFLLVHVYNLLIGSIKAPKYVLGVSVGAIYLVSITVFGILSGGCINFSLLSGPSLFSLSLKDWPYYLVA